MRHGIEMFLAAALCATVVGLLGGSARAAPRVAEEPPDGPLLVVRAVDAAGSPLAGAQAFLLDVTAQTPLSSHWVTASADGLLPIPRYGLRMTPDGHDRVKVLVRAPGHAARLVEGRTPAADPLQVTLEPAPRRTLVLRTTDPRGLPDDLVPSIFVEDLAVATWMSAVEYDDCEPTSAAVVEPVGDGAFRCVLPEGVASFWVLVDHPGFLRAFQAGPFDVDGPASDVVTVELPNRAACEVAIEPQGAPSITGCGVVVRVMPDISAGPWTFKVAESFVSEPRQALALVDLAPGRYLLAGYGGDASSVYLEGVWNERRTLDLAPGADAATTFTYVVLDDAVLDAEFVGDQRATVTVRRHDGSPASGLPYKLYSETADARRLYREGVLPVDGPLALEGLPKSHDGLLVLEVAGRRLPSLSPAEGEDTFVFHLPPLPGDTAPDASFVTLEGEEEIDLASLRGQVVFLEFWASWCGPCQAPMAHSDAIAARRDDWEGRAVLLGASIDDELQRGRDHVAKRGWNHVLQTHCGVGDSSAAGRYGVRAVPSAFLIDADGAIVWAGHPNGFDVEAQIDRLLDQRP